MEKMLNSITCTSDYVTGSSTSGSSVVDMSQYDSAVVRAHVCKIDHLALTTIVAATLSVYETTAALNTAGTLVSNATVSLASGTREEAMEIEVKASSLSATGRYIYGHIAVSAASASVGTSLLIERGQARYDAQND